MSCCFEREGQNEGFEDTNTCPFNGETEFFDASGRSYCRFHLPMIDESGEHTAKTVWRLSDHKHFFRRLRDIAQNHVNNHKKVQLSGIVFPIGIKPSIIFGLGSPVPSVDFGQCTFVGRAKFQTACFEGVAGFRGTVFEGAAMFPDAVFQGPASFRSTMFKSYVVFLRARFNREAVFDFASFLDTANFDKSVFEKVAGYESASFGSWTSFRRAKFLAGGGPCFDFAAFNNGVFFDSAEFTGNTSFNVRTERNRQWNAQRDVAVENDVNARQDKNFPHMSFKGAVFRSRVDFSNRHFLEATDFSQVIFEVAPEFHNCVLHQDTDFSGTQFRDTKGEHAARAYRILKRAMGDVGARNEEALFYAKEQDALRQRRDTPWSIRIMSWIYMVSSDYGRSYVRPLLVLVLTTAFFSLIYWLWEYWLGGSGDATGAFAFSMKQIVRPFHVWTVRGMVESEMTGIVVHWPLALRLLATIQSVMSIGSVTLLLLALRRQFRLH